MDWINGHVRKPVKHSMYFVKAGGTKKLVHWYEFDRLCELYDEVLWLEEACDKFVAAKAKPVYEFKRDEEKPAVLPVVLSRPITTQWLQPAEAKGVITWPIPPVCSALPELPKNEKQQSTIVSGGRFKRLDMKLISNEREIKMGNKKFLPAFTREQLALPVVEREFGKYPDVEISHFDNPYCSIVRKDEHAWKKFKVRASIINKAKIANKIKEYDEFGLYHVRLLFPILKGLEVIPVEIIAEMEWVYGKTGVQVINMKLYNCYRSQLSTKNKKQQNATTANGHSPIDHESGTIRTDLPL